MGISYNPSIVTDGLVLCLDAANRRSYPGAGTIWTDLSGNGNNGTLTNGPTFSGANGGSVVFDGTNDYIENSSPNLGITGNSSITLSCWFYFAGTSNIFNALFCYGGGPVSGDTFAIGLNATNTYDVNFQFNGANVTRSNGNVYSSNTWYNLVGTKIPGAANTTTKLYLNGNELSIAASTNITPNVTSRVIRIGRWTNDGVGNEFYYKGQVSNCLIYNRALSGFEIRQNYNATKGRYL